MEDLLSGEVDVIGNIYTAYLWTFQYADFSAPEYYVPGHSIISVEPHKGIRWYSYITVFPWYMWLPILLSIPAAGIVLYLLRMYGQGGDEEARVGDGIWDSAQVILWDSIRQPQPSWGMCSLLSTYMVMTYLIVTFYMGEYTAELTAPKYVKAPIDSLEQLWESNMTLLAMDGFYDIYLYDYQHVEGIGEKVIKYLSPPDKLDLQGAMIELQENPDLYVVIYSYDVIYNFPDTLSNYSRRYHQSKQRLSNQYCPLHFPK